MAKLADKKVVQMKLSVDHVLALTDTEELYAWGDNSNGNFGGDVKIYFEKRANWNGKYSTCGANNTT